MYANTGEYSHDFTETELNYLTGDSDPEFVREESTTAAPKPKRRYARKHNNDFVSNTVRDLNIKSADYIVIESIKDLGLLNNTKAFAFVLNCFDRMTLAAIKTYLEEICYAGTLYCNVAFANNPWQVYNGSEEPNTRIKHNIAAFRRIVSEAGYSLNILLETEQITNWCVIE